MNILNTCHTQQKYSVDTLLQIVNKDQLECYNKPLVDNILKEDQYLQELQDSIFYSVFKFRDSLNDKIIKKLSDQKKFVNTKTLQKNMIIENNHQNQFMDDVQQQFQQKDFQNDIKEKMVQQTSQIKQQQSQIEKQNDQIKMYENQLQQINDKFDNLKKNFSYNSVEGVLKNIQFFDEDIMNQKQQQQTQQNMQSIQKLMGNNKQLKNKSQKQKDSQQMANLIQQDNIFFQCYSLLSSRFTENFDE